MQTDQLLTELERQQKYLEQLPPNFDFPLFNAKHAVESQRKSGYRTTAAASREIVDNAIEAGANRIHIVFDSRREGGKNFISSIAFIDNGSGMLPKMARYALSWGGGTHFDDPNFIGRFGFGLPNASINQTRRVEVFTRTRKGDKFTKVYLDLNEFTSFGRQSIPEPTNADLPDFVQKYLEKNKWVLEHGTIVLWQKPDRLSYKRVAQLREHLVDDFGVTYRYLLNQSVQPLELIVDGLKVQPVDPLFLLPEGRYYIPTEEGGAQLVDERFIPVKYYLDSDTGERHLKKLENEEQLQPDDPNLLAIGTINTRIARFPVGFATPKKSDPRAAPDASERFQIRKTRRGMSFVRAGREIQTVDAFPRSAHDEASGLGDWPLLQSYAYSWGIEVKFGPELDEVFGITNDKQGVRPMEDFWRVLHDDGIDDLLHRENEWQRDHRKHETPKAEPAVVASPAESAARDADIAAAAKPTVPDHAKTRALEGLQAEVTKRATISGQTIDEVRKAIDLEQKRRPYKIDYYESEDGPFYKPEWVGTQIVVFINRKHPFYETLYAPLLEIAGGLQAKEGIDLVLIALAKGELNAREFEMAQWYETQRKQVWSEFLRTGMRSLQQRLQPAEEEAMESPTQEQVPAAGQTTL